MDETLGGDCAQQEREAGAIFEDPVYAAAGLACAAGIRRRYSQSRHAATTGAPGPKGLLRLDSDCRQKGRRSGGPPAPEYSEDDCAGRFYSGDAERLRSQLSVLADIIRKIPRGKV